MAILNLTVSVWRQKTRKDAGQMVKYEVKGKITAEREVTLSPQGRVEANIQAGSIVLAGQVKGNLAAKGDVSLPADSRLDGHIRAHNVDVGGVVKGNIVGRGAYCWMNASNPSSATLIVHAACPASQARRATTWGGIL